MSAFVTLFSLAVLSFAIRNEFLIKLFSIVGLGLAGFFALSNYPLPLSGFEASSGSVLFEIVLFIVIGAYIVSEDENINITQSLFITTASIALLESVTIVNFIVSFEALSIISFVLVSHIKNETQASGAMKMFISGSIATGLLFLGATFYLFENHDLNEPLQNVGLFGEVGIWILLMGVFYKLTIVPMHTWAVDSYSSVKPSHAALLSGVTKSVAVLAIFKVFSPFFEQFVDINRPILILLAIVTMTLGNLLALFQKRIGKILAYSSIAHAGYMLLAFVAIKSSYASTAILYIAIAYIFMQTALFILLDKLSNSSTDICLNDLKGLYKKEKISAFILSIQIFSLAGVPLLAGFLSKAVLVYAVVDVDLPIVALVTLLNSALSVGYYAWIIKHIYFDEMHLNSRLVSLSAVSIFAQMILLAGTLYFGIFAWSVFDVTL